MRISDWSSDVCSSDLQALAQSLRRLDPDTPDTVLAAAALVSLTVSAGHAGFDPADPQRLVDAPPAWPPPNPCPHPHQPPPHDAPPHPPPPRAPPHPPPPHPSHPPRPPHRNTHPTHPQRTPSPSD